MRLESRGQDKGFQVDEAPVPRTKRLQQLVLSYEENPWTVPVGPFDLKQAV